MRRITVFLLLSILALMLGCSSNDSGSITDIDPGGGSSGGTDGGSGGDDGGGSGDDGGGTTAPSAWQQAMLDSLNDHRASGATCGGETLPPVGALAWDDLLAEAALTYATDMHENDAWNHIGSDGDTLRDRVDATGYAWSTIGENIAKGQTSVSQVMAGWMASPGHCRNIMNGSFTEVGLARVGNSWVQVFGRPSGSLIVDN